MKNNKGFGTKEVAFLTVGLLFILAGLLYTLLGGNNKQKFKTFNENALTFQKTMVGNQASFLNPDYVYLQEGIDQELIKNIKNALGPGNCDPMQSKVVTRDGRAYTTLKCGKYLIDDYEIKDVDKIDIYVVSEWSEEKPTAKDGEEIEERILYNCMDGSKVVYDEYYEEKLLPYLVGRDYNETLRRLEAIESKTDLNIVKKKYYRTKKKLEIKNK